MKKILLLFMVLLSISVSFAHPGRTASDGCHYCRTNCTKWGVEWNARHCHGQSNSSSSNYKGSNSVSINSTNTLNFYPTTSLSPSEIQQAILRMYTNGLTIYTGTATFRGEDYITRQEAAKFFVEFTEKFFDTGSLDTNQTISLNDLEKSDTSLQPYIKKAYQFKILKGTNGNFLPFNNLTRAQAIAVIIRIISGTQNENGFSWYEEYYYLANNYGLLKDLDFAYSTLDLINIKRQEIAVLLYRLSQKSF